MYYVGIVIKREDIPQSIELKFKSKAVAECLKVLITEFIAETDYAIVLTDNRHDILKEYYDVVVTGKDTKRMSGLNRYVVTNKTKDFQMNIRTDTIYEANLIDMCLRGNKRVRFEEVSCEAGLKSDSN